MAEYGLKPEGFLPKPLSVILAELTVNWIAIFSPDADLDPDSDAGQEVGLIAGMFADHWEVSAETATILDGSRVQGTLQSAYVQLNGIKRQENLETQVVAEVTGTEFETLLAGAVAATVAGDRFILVGDVVFTAGPDTSNWIAESFGPVPCAAGTLTVIAEPKPDWLSITNAAPAFVVGRFEEEDGALRRRREVTTETGAVNMFTAMQSAVRALLGVVDARILENTTTSTDGNGLTAHSFRAIVEGGDDDEIAQAIWDNRPGGIGFSGTSSGTAVDRDGNNQTVDFSRPILVPIHIALVIATTTEFPSGGDALIKNAIIDFNAGNLLKPGCEADAIDEDRFFPGIRISENVLYSKQYTPINSVPGHEVTAYTLSRTNDPPLVGDVVSETISDLEKAQFLFANIDVT